VRARAGREHDAQKPFANISTLELSRSDASHVEQEHHQYYYMFLLAAKTLANENLSSAHTSGWLFETTLHLSVVVVVGTELILLPLPPASAMHIMKSKCAPLNAAAERKRKMQIAPREKSPRQEKSLDGD
jgi:hypothetical protein